MIVPMKKITLFCLESDRDQTLDALRSLGAVHVAPVQPPAGKNLDEALARQTRAHRALEILPDHDGKVRPPFRDTAEKAVDRIWSLFHRKELLAERTEMLEDEERDLEPFGDFSPGAISALADRGIPVSLYLAPPKTELRAPEGALLRVIRRTKRLVSFAVVGAHEAQRTWEQVRLPARSLSEVRAERSKLAVEAAELETELDHLKAARTMVEELSLKTGEEVEFLKVRTGMGGAKKIAFLQGYCPERLCARVSGEAAARGWGLLIEDPAAGDDVPTLVENPAWIRPIGALFKLINLLPGYAEADASWTFLLFFSLFFAMLVGDLGYGIIYLLLTILMRRKMPKAPPEPFRLLYILSACTMAWGLLTGSCFGVGFASLPGPFTAIRAWLAQDDNMMRLCFLIGAVHLTIAHAWNILRSLNSTIALAQAGWILSTWTMYFMARNMILGDSLPGWVLYAFVAGIALIVLFMTPVRRFKSEWYNHVMLPLNLVSNFVDVVSYVRLYAVGIAGLAVAQSFNATAGGLGPLGLGTGLAGALILFFGHGLNIILSVMSVLVHGVRLNTLEFSGHLGVQWTGRPYDPFARKTAADGTAAAT